VSGAAALDRAALRLLRTRFHAPPLERAAIAYTTAGEFGALWFAAALGGAALDPERRGSWLGTAALVPAVLTANAVVKQVVRRPRPHLEGLLPLGRRPSSLSFPSGHAATSFAAAVAIGSLAPQLRPAFLVAAAAMALTRPYLGVHYPSDVVVGALEGAALARAARPALARFR
jgi:membrane-associated phospholipid phosphatase